MKKSIEGILLFIVLLVLPACSENSVTQYPTATPPIVQEHTATQESVTATATVSPKFMFLLNTETPTPIPTAISVEQENIKNVIQSYFDIRYRAFETLEFDGFGNLLSNEPESIVFLDAESGKLNIELKHAELNQLRYVAYEYFLDYQNISINPTNQIATVSLSKRENTIYEISAMLTSGEPIMSSGYNEEHTILLHQEDGEWKIVSDTYNDYLWRTIRETGTSADEILRDKEAQPMRPPACFTGLFPQYMVSPIVDIPNSDASSSPKIKAVYLNGKTYDPEWPYSYPFTNLYFESDGESALRIIVELDNAYISGGKADAGWQVVIYPHVEGEKTIDQPAFVLDNLQEISCDSRSALLVETSLEKIQNELGTHRVFDYQVVDEKGDIRLEHAFYLNPYGSYLISDTFGDIQGLDGGVIGYPNLVSENKIIFPREGSVISIHEPQGGFFRLHYWISTSNLELSSGIWTEDTSDEVVIQVFLYRDDSMYDVEKSFTIPDRRKIRGGAKNYSFKVSFTIEELRESLGNGNAFYLRFLDKNGYILGEDYFYFVPYTQSTP